LKNLTTHFLNCIKYEIMPGMWLTDGETASYQEAAVELAAFTHDGTTLVTVESMPVESASSGHRWHSLKFWDVVSTGSLAGGFTTNSVVNDPHFGHITSLACHPTQTLVATTCASVSMTDSEGFSEGYVDESGGGFRLWRKRHFKRSPGTPADAPTWHWRCLSANSYKGAKLLSEQHVACSARL
jgi:hypothetical protein